MVVSVPASGAFGKVVLRKTSKIIEYDPFSQIKRSKIDNRGLYAADDIKKGTKIIQYKGKIITVKESETNPKYDNDKAIYLFNLNKRYDLDGDFKFNTARLINHSCEPNCEVTGTGFKVWVYAIKNIKKGTQRK